MKGSLADTIVALSTPEGPGLRAVVRLSGPRSWAIAGRLFHAASGRPEGHRCLSGRVPLEGEGIPASAGYFRGPRSFTREDVVEIALPSSMPLVQALLRLCLREGARLAEPGEFTRRAYVNGRLDLGQAEGVLELIRARGEGERRAGIALLEGGLSSRVAGIRERLEGALALLEASLDFEEGETGHVPVEELLARLEESRGLLVAARSWEERRSPACAGFSVFLWGEPNVGKSSLLNRLDPEARAMVSPVPGTTRDCLEGRIVWRGMSFRILDAAGACEGGGPVERQAQGMAERFRQEADLVLGVLDASRPEVPAFLLQAKADLYVLNKGDLPARLPPEALPAGRPRLVTSALEGWGIDALKDAFVSLVRGGGAERSGSRAAVSERHRRSLEGALASADEARGLLQEGHALDVVAGCLRQALSRLDEISGQTVAEGILDRIFSRFCIGK